ncbi:MAG: carboxymuconolactone decarboxylase family protein [Candidatus Bathyarchaeia archaeon]
MKETSPKGEWFQAIKYIQPVKPDAAEGLVAGVYAQVRRDFGRVVEPFILHSPLPELLAGVWMACRETELLGDVPRVVKETVAAVVSRLNHCQYCVDAHTIILMAMGEGDVAKTVEKGEHESIPDTNLRRIAEWANATTSPESEALLSPPFTRQDAPEIVGTAVFYHYINRMATVLLSDTPLPTGQRWFKDPMKKVAGLMFSAAIQRPKTGGESLLFLPKANLPASLSWARASANVAAGFAGFASVIEKFGAAALPVEARRFVQEQVDEWNGKSSELGLAWSEEAICKFDEPAQHAMRLALLAAVAPRQVDDEIVAAFQRHFPGDEKLLGALSWASFTAAKRIGTWLRPLEKRKMAQ